MRRLADEGRSALVIWVPEAEPALLPFWRTHQAGTPDGVMPHITILFPFAPDAAEDDRRLADLEQLFAAQAPFDFSLTHSARFPHVLYLAPEPARPFRTLIDVVAARFPEYPPYGGVVTDITPHLTVAHVEDASVLAALARRFAEEVEPGLPIRARAREVWLLVNEHGRWRRCVSFGLGYRWPQSYRIRKLGIDDP